MVHDDQQDDGADDAGRAPSLPFIRQVVAAGALGEQARWADDGGGGATALEIAAHLAAALGALVHTTATSALQHAQAMSNAVPTTPLPVPTSQFPAEAKAIVESDNDNNKRVGDDDGDDDGFEEVKASDDVHAEVLVGPGLDRRSGHLHAALQRDVEASRRFLRELRQQHDVSSEGSLSLASSSSSADPRDYLWCVRRGAQEEHREHGEVWFDGDEGTQPHSVAIPSVYPPTTTTGRMLVSSVLGCPSTRAVNAIDARVLMGDTPFVPPPPLLPRLRPPTDEEVVVDERARFQQLVHDTAVSDDDDDDDGDDTAEVVEVDMVEVDMVEDDDDEPVSVPSGLQLLRRRASVA